MTPHVVIRTARDGDAVALAARMRLSDRVEVHTLYGQTPFDAVTGCTAQSREVMVAVVNGEVGAAWGVIDVSALTGVGLAWVLTAEPIEQVPPRMFMRVSRAFADQYMQRYRVLFNFIDAHYEKAVKWARWLGFDLYGPMSYGPHGAPAILAKRCSDAAHQEGQDRTQRDGASVREQEGEERVLRFDQQGKGKRGSPAA